MLKPKPVVLVQNDLPDFKYLLTKRKKSVKSFLESNQIKTDKQLKSWISANRHEYNFSESFISEAASFLTVESIPEPSVVVPETVSTIETGVEDSITETLSSHLSEEETYELVALPVREKNSKKRNKATQTV